jgi:hypothetical protein
MQTFGPAKLRREQFEKILDSDIIPSIIQLKQIRPAAIRSAVPAHAQGGLHDTDKFRPSRSHSKIELLQFSNSELTENRRDHV